MVKKRQLILSVIAAILITAVLTFTFTNFMSLRLGDKVIISSSDYEIVKESRKLLTLKKYIDKYYLEPADSEKLMDGAIKGMFQALGDPYSVYMNEKEFKEFDESTSGSYGGIGVIVTEKDGYVTVVAPIEDTPGEKAGLKTGDKIIKVDGAEVTGIGLDKATTLMKGKKGTKVVLTVSRENKTEPLVIEIKREDIVLKTVKAEILKDEIGYIRISMFDQDTGKEFKRALADIKTHDAKGLIIDLRQNPGGFVTQCVEVADELLDKGTIFYTEDKNKNQVVTSSKDGKIDIPFVVLVDEGSASASEIVSGAVKDRKAGLLIGTKTFGKGLVQSVEKLGDGSGFKLTIQKYYTPNGIDINKVGIEPDIEVKALEIKEGQRPEDVKDVQLDRAIEEIQKLIK
ncbi:S41 family peptidase [Lutispora saccharofermentans]|uniref:S41 family peptidase n=1 Tax=Lutispora saccharofermentans TaxID=3024236 RepID=A0ABT1NMB6_9FIRM|nr:S41 family peptidase [Lutispora saccharofermentans]MCQ1531441.1 S41 family peptidase [Lutispora saccharofermentans]